MSMIIKFLIKTEITITQSVKITDWATSQALAKAKAMRNSHTL